MEIRTKFLILQYKVYIMKKVLKEEILKLRGEGKKYDEIRDILKCTKSVISYHCRRAGIDNPNDIRRLSKEKIKSIDKLYLEGNSSDEIANILDCSKTTVLKYLTVERRVKEKTLTTSQSVVNWRKRKKEELVLYKGGKCNICGYDKCIEALAFHHLDPMEKDFNIGGKSWAIETLKKEADKCILVCHNCHTEIHQGLHKDKGL